MQGRWHVRRVFDSSFLLVWCLVRLSLDRRWGSCGSGALVLPWCLGLTCYVFSGRVSFGDPATQRCVFNPRVTGVCWCSWWWCRGVGDSRLWLLWGEAATSLTSICSLPDFEDQFFDWALSTSSLELFAPVCFVYVWSVPPVSSIRHQRLTLLRFSEKASDEEWKLLWSEESLPPRWFRRLIGISQCRYDVLPWGFVAVVPFSLSLQVKERGSGSICSCRSVPVFLLSVKVRGLHRALYRGSFGASWVCTGASERFSHDLCSNPFSFRHWL